MTLLRRVVISFSGSKTRFILLFSIVAVLSTLMSFSIVVHQTNQNTDRTLRQKLPAIATIRQDESAIAHAQNNPLSEEQFSPLTVSTIREVGQLPFVRSFDYTAWGFNFFSSSLQRYFNRSLFSNFDIPFEYLTDHGSIRDLGAPIEEFVLKGTNMPETGDIAAGLLTLVDGRTFSEEEISNGDLVAIVSTTLLQENNLELGGTLPLTYKIFDQNLSHLETSLFYQNENLQAKRDFNFVIIGVFEDEFAVDDQTELNEMFRYISIVNQIFVPNRVLENTVYIYIETFAEDNPELISPFLEVDNFEELIQFENILFLLYDPVDLIEFREVASALLPFGWVVDDLTNVYSDISSAMENLDVVFTYVLFGSFLLATVAISMVVLMLLKDRQNEIGIYLALGEKKFKIMSQILLELVVVVTFAATAGLVIGMVASSTVSRNLVRDGLAAQVETVHEHHVTAIYSGSPAALGFNFTLNHEEMLEAYEIEFNLSTVGLIYGSIFSSVLFSTILPLYYVTKLSPKEILLKSTIG